VLNYADRYVLPAILPKVQQDLGLTTIEEGLLGSSFLLVYGLTTLPLGAWADRGVRKNIISLWVAVWSVATTLGGLSRNFWQLISVRTVLGVGEAGYGPASLSLLGDFFTRAQRGRVLSYWSVGNLVGAAIGFTLGGLVADAFGWRWAFYIVGIPGLIAAYLAWRISEPERGVFDREVDAVTLTKGSGLNEVEAIHSGIGKGFWTRTKKILQVPTYLAVIGGLVFSFFTIGGTSFWLPTYLVNTFSLSVGKAGIITGAVLVGSGLVGTLVGGWLADYVQLRRPDGRLLVSALGFLIGAPLVLITLLIHNLPLFIALFAIGGISLSFCTGPIFAVVQDVITPGARATALGLTGLFAHLLGDAAAPSVIGLIADRYTLGFALIITTPTFLFLAGLACLIGTRTVARDMRRMQEQMRQNR
jgi:MFS transporter, Spinster family, sphingosine-1-phosphate transporter